MGAAKLTLRSPLSQSATWHSWNKWESWGHDLEGEL